jgi:tetrahydromethanopterin S-methyltransferase subunit G
VKDFFETLKTLSPFLFFFLGVIGTLYKVLWDQNEKKQAEQDKNIKELQDKWGTLPRDYVMKEDFVRATFQMEKKLDSIDSKVNEMNANLARFMGSDQEREKSGS